MEHPRPDYFGVVYNPLTNEFDGRRSSAFANVRKATGKEVLSCLPTNGYKMFKIETIAHIKGN